MATGILTDDSPTPPPPTNAPQSMLTTRFSVSGTRPSLDEAADRILVKAKSPLGEGEAQKVVETLEKVSREHP